VEVDLEVEVDVLEVKVEILVVVGVVFHVLVVLRGLDYSVFQEKKGQALAYLQKDVEQFHQK
ncbi:hypothetical protein A2U01_0050857, partial [Trifolium medium]|nr:hypothetical protein [Trifolium medium]